MKLTAANTKGKEVKIMDAMGQHISYVFSFDTKTCEMEGYLPIGPKKLAVKKGRDGNTIVKFKVKIPGAYATIDGVKVY